MNLPFINRIVFTYLTKSAFYAGIVLLISVGSVIFLSSCAPRISHIKFSAESPEVAVEEMISIKYNLIKFQADIDLQLTIPNGSYKVKAELQYERENRWLIHISGPFGLKLARIETFGKRYIVDMLITGSSISGYLDEPIAIGAMDLELPRLDMFVNLMLPVIDITDNQQFSISPHSSIYDSSLVINYEVEDDQYEIRLNLSYNPLIVYSEERSVNYNFLYRREFEYKSAQSQFPIKMSISHQDISLRITYSNIHYQTRILKGITAENQS